MSENSIVAHGCVCVMIRRYILLQIAISFLAMAAQAINIEFTDISGISSIKPAYQ